MSQQPPKPEFLSRRGVRSPDGTRERIVLQTRKTIAEAGLRSVKARDIARRAGVSVGTIYNMFGPLDNLVRMSNAVTYDDLFEHQSAALDAARADGAQPSETLRRLARAYLDWVRTHHALWSATLAFNRERRDDDVPEWYSSRERALLGIIEDALSDFPHEWDGEMRLHTARALWASIHGIVAMAMGATALLLPVDELELQMDVIIGPVAAGLMG